MNGHLVTLLFSLLSRRLCPSRGEAFLCRGHIVPSNLHGCPSTLRNRTNRFIVINLNLRVYCTQYLPLFCLYSNGSCSMVILLPRPLSPQRSREWTDPLGSSVTASVSHAVRHLQEHGCRSQPWASREIGSSSEEKSTPHQATSSDSSPVWDMLASGKLRHGGMAASRAGFS